MYADNIFLLSEAIDVPRNKFHKWKQALRERVRKLTFEKRWSVESLQKTDSINSSLSGSPG